MKLSQAYREYCSYCLSYHGRSEETVRRYRTHLRMFRQFVLQKEKQTSICVDSVKLYHILDFVGSIRSKDVKSSTVSKYACTVRCFFKWCYMMDIPCLKWDKIPHVQKKEESNPRSLTQAQVQSLWRCAMDEKDELIGMRNLLVMKIAYYTGMRGEEVRYLTRQQLLSDHSQVGITGKGKRCRTVFINDECKKLAQLLYVGYLARGIDNQRVFVSLSNRSRGQRMSAHILKKMFRKYREKLGLPDYLTFHSFRHTFATTLLIKGGVDIRVVQHGLGHSNLSATQIYTHIPQERCQQFNDIMKMA